MHIVTMTITDIKIVFVGDKGVGKSSIIESFVSEEFAGDKIARVLEPQEYFFETDCKVTCIDSDPSEIEATKRNINSADIIVIVHAYGDRASLDSINQTWIPLLAEASQLKKPFYIIQNKMDLKLDMDDGISNNSLGSEEELATEWAAMLEDAFSVFMDYDYFMGFLEYSAKTRSNKKELMHELPKASFYPLHPIWDEQKHDFNEVAKRNFKRIFWILDEDKDGLLSDEEMDKFQLRCFKEPFPEGGLQKLKDILFKNDSQSLALVKTPSASDGHQTGITFEGFMNLLRSFITDKNQQMVWDILQEIGLLNTSLKIKSLKKSTIQKALPKHDPTTEQLQLSASGKELLTKIFGLFDVDKDDLLSAKELEEAFSLIPTVDQPDIVPIPFFGDLCDTSNNIEDMQDSNYRLTLSGWIAQWSVIAFLQPQTLVRYLTFWGFANLDTERDAVKDLFTVKKMRKFRKEPTDAPNVIQCYVFGAPKCGKTSLLRGLVNHDFTDKYTPTTKRVSAVNTVEYDGQEYFLVMHEYADQEVQAVLSSQEEMDQCDVACLVYDGNDPYSFAYVAERQKQIADTTIPCVYVITKSDLALEDQKYEVSPQEFCHEFLGLPWPPVICSMKENNTGDLYKNLVVTALNPEIAQPTVEEDDEEEGQKRGKKKLFRTLALLGALTFAGTIAWKLLKSRKEQQS